MSITNSDVEYFNKGVPMVSKSTFAPSDLSTGDDDEEIDGISDIIGEDGDDGASGGDVSDFGDTATKS